MSICCCMMVGTVSCLECANSHLNYKTQVSRKLKAFMVIHPNGYTECRREWEVVWK